MSKLISKLGLKVCLPGDASCVRIRGLSFSLKLHMAVSTDPCVLDCVCSEVHFHGKGRILCRNAVLLSNLYTRRLNIVSKTFAFENYKAPFVFYGCKS